MEAHELLRVAAPLGDDRRRRDVEKRRLALGGDGLGEQRLARAGRAVQQQPLPRLQQPGEEVREAERHHQALLEHALHLAELGDVVPPHVGVLLDHVALQPRRELAQLGVGRQPRRQPRLADPVLPHVLLLGLDLLLLARPVAAHRERRRVGRLARLALARVALRRLRRHHRRARGAGAGADGSRGLRAALATKRPGGAAAVHGWRAHLVGRARAVLRARAARARAVLRRAAYAARAACAARAAPEAGHAALAVAGRQRVDGV